MFTGARWPTQLHFENILLGWWSELAEKDWQWQAHQQCLIEQTKKRPRGFKPLLDDLPNKIKVIKFKSHVATS